MAEKTVDIEFHGTAGDPRLILKRGTTMDTVFIVICYQCSSDVYVVATHQTFHAREQAEAYLETVSSTRKPLVVELPIYLLVLETSRTMDLLEKSRHG